MKIIVKRTIVEVFVAYKEKKKIICRKEKKKTLYFCVLILAGRISILRVFLINSVGPIESKTRNYVGTNLHVKQTVCAKASLERIRWCVHWIFLKIVSLELERLHERYRCTESGFNKTNYK